MAYDYQEALDEMASTFLTPWKALTPAPNGGTVVPVEWPNQPVVDPPLNTGKAPWARFNIRHSRSDRKAIADGLYTRRGTVTVQIFLPAGKQGLAAPYSFGKVALDAFEGKRSGSVILSRCVLKEVGQDGPWFQVNVQASFAYDVVK